MKSRSTYLWKRPSKWSFFQIFKNLLIRKLVSTFFLRDFWSSMEGIKTTNPFLKIGDTDNIWTSEWMWNKFYCYVAKLRIIKWAFPWRFFFFSRNQPETFIRTPIELVFLYAHATFFYTIWQISTLTSFSFYINQ